MSAKTEIAWCDSTWSPVRGCTRVSRGCQGCYAERMAARNLPGMRSPTTSQPFAIMTPSGPRWTGRVELIESQLEIPLHWRKPRRIFVNSMSDTWHEKLHLRDIARIYAVAAYCHWHTFMILTKRPESRLAAMQSGRFRELVEKAWGDLLSLRTELPEEEPDLQWPLPNVWEGASVEDRASLYRIDQLRETPAALRFLSLEPLLEDLGTLDLRGIGWVIVGGESGPGARPMHPAWARSVRDQCASSGTSYFFKQWGEWAPECEGFHRISGRRYSHETFAWGKDGRKYNPVNPAPDDFPKMVYRVGKRGAGRLLDGREWSTDAGGIEVKCFTCGESFDPRESLMGAEGQCQECWEAECDKSWWEFMRQLDSLDGRIFDELLEVKR